MASIVQEVSVAKDAHSAFNALTQEKDIAGWWTDNLSVRPEAGSLAEFRFRNGAFIIELEVAELQQDKKVRWILRKGQPHWAGTSITWLLEPVTNGTTVHFSHDGFAEADEAFQATSRNWEYFLDSLKSYLETGKGTPGLP